MKILFVHLPRTAGTFIREYGHETKLINYYANYKQRDGHLPAREIKEPDKWFKFGLVRNPFDWYVSQYHYFADKTKPNLESGIFNGVDGGLWGKGFKNKFPDFNSWIDYGVENPMPNFWLTDVYKSMFCDEKGKLLVDYVGRFELLYYQINLVLEMNNIVPTVEISTFKGNRNKSKHGFYRKYLSNRSIGIILEKDQEIFEGFSYYDH